MANAAIIILLLIAIALTGFVVYIGDMDTKEDRIFRVCYLVLLVGISMSLGAFIVLI